VNRVYRPSPAATAQLLTDLAEGLAATGFDIHVVAAGAESGPFGGVEVHRTGAGEVHGGIFSRVLNYRRFIRGARAELGRLVRAGDVVVPMTDPPMLGTAVADVVRQRGGTVVHWLQDIYPEIAMAHAGPGLGLLFRTFRARRDASWQTARRCVVLGEDMAAVVAGRGIPRAAITVQPNWAPPELAVPPDPEAVGRQRRQWAAENSFVVVYSGNLGRVHEFEAALGAAERLAARRDILFVFVGGGARLAEVRAAAHRRQLAGVRFQAAVPREQLPFTLAAADAHLVTLRTAFDGLVFPSKLAGALASARPILFVGSPGNEITRLLLAGRCGVATTPGDGAGLAAVIEAWAVNRELARELGVRSRSVYEERFSFETARKRWAELLGEAASPSNGIATA
jgi:glycosyltransferase involved in cell wall biosynthesis